MKKKTFLYSAIVFILVIAGVLSMFLINNGLNLKSVAGTIIVREKSADSNSYGLVLLRLPDLRETSLNFEGNNACFAGTDSKFLIEDKNGKVFLCDGKDKKEIYRSRNNLMTFSVSYVDDIHFSVVDDGKLIKVNAENGEKETVSAGVDAVHSWSDGGKIVYYSKFINSKSHIIKYDVSYDKQTVIATGNSPRVSKNGAVIAFLSEDKKYLIIKDFSENKEWKYKKDVSSFCLSPDGKYLLTSETGKDKNRFLKIVDYKTEKSKVIKKDVSQKYEFDWIE